MHGQGYNPYKEDPVPKWDKIWDEIEKEYDFVAFFCHFKDALFCASDVAIKITPRYFTFVNEMRVKTEFSLYFFLVSH